MVMVDVDNELYEQIKSIIERKKIDYPTMQNFVNKAVRKLIKEEEV